MPPFELSCENGIRKAFIKNGYFHVEFLILDKIDRPERLNINSYDVLQLNLPFFSDASACGFTKNPIVLFLFPLAVWLYNPSDAMSQYVHPVSTEKRAVSSGFLMDVTVLTVGMNYQLEWNQKVILTIGAHALVPFTGVAGYDVINGRFTGGLARGEMTMGMVIGRMRPSIGYVFNYLATGRMEDAFLSGFQFNFFYAKSRQQSVSFGMRFNYFNHASLNSVLTWEPLFVRIQLPVNRQ